MFEIGEVGKSKKLINKNEFVFCYTFYFLKILYGDLLLHHTIAKKYFARFNQITLIIIVS